MIGLLKKLVAAGLWSGTAGADIVTGIAAAGNGSQANGTRLTASVNNVSAVAAGVTDSVVLPVPGGIGETVLVINSDAADTLKVYPASGGYINAEAQNAPLSLTTGKRALFVAESATAWSAFVSP